jgi:alpha-L-fucosidase
VHAEDASEAVIPHPWEECRGIGHSFGYNRAETVADYSSPEKLIALLVDTVARGGNLLLDIGPTADGRIPVIMQERLLQMGQWLETNGEAIYGTRRWREHAEGETIRYTAKGDAVYATVLGWPGKTVALETPRSSSATRVELLGSGEEIHFDRPGGGLRITLPESARADTYAWTFKLTGVR